MGSWLVALLLLCAGSVRAAADFDDDEFEAVAPASGSGAKESGSVPPSPHEPLPGTAERVVPQGPLFVPPPSAAESLVSRFGAEAVFVLFVAAFAAAFAWGTRRNKELAIDWLRAVRPVLEEQFSRIDTLTRLSPASFRLYCTGRLNCFAAEVTLQLRPRQDLLWSGLGLFMASNETMVIDVPMTGKRWRQKATFPTCDSQLFGADKLDPFVFALFPARKERRLRDEMPDLALAKLRESPVKRLVLVADSGKVAQRLLAPDVAASLEFWSKWIDLIYCSDSFELYETEYKQMARFVTKLPQSHGELQVLLRLVFRFVDAFASVTLSAPGQAKARAARKKWQTSRSKGTREELDAKAEEKKLAALAAEREKLASLTGKERIRAEEKMQRKELKEKTKRKMKIVKG